MRLSISSQEWSVSRDIHGGFAIRATTEHAIINDFAHGQDHIRLATNLFADFDAIKAAAVQHGADVVVSGAHLDILLKNLQLATLTASDFQFV